MLRSGGQLRPRDFKSFPDKTGHNTLSGRDLPSVGATFPGQHWWPLYWARRYDEAIARYRKVVQHYPIYWQGHYFLGLNLLQQGEFGDAIYELETARDLTDIPWRLAGLSHAYALAGRHIEARKVLDEMVELSTRRYVSAYDIAAACSGLDERDRTLEFLEKALEDRCWGMALIRLEPMFDSLRSDPRFTRLLETMNPSH